MQVRDGMNRIVVTVGPTHTLREAARRMAAADVGAAVVLDPDGAGPGILTERDLLYCTGRDQDLDVELVGDHMGQRLKYASADWQLERAAEQMVRARFRHVVVLDGSDVVGILSMRDIVRCWMQDGATTPTLKASEATATENTMGSGRTMPYPDSWQLIQS
jgi:CBS domain-containing protein